MSTGCGFSSTWASSHLADCWPCFPPTSISYERDEVEVYQLVDLFHFIYLSFASALLNLACNYSMKNRKKVSLCTEDVKNLPAATVERGK